MVLGVFGGTVMFLMYGLIAIVGVLFYRRGQVAHDMCTDKQESVELG
jgi:hypothetical protein